MIFVAFLILLCLLYISGVYGFAGILFIITLYGVVYVIPALIFSFFNKEYRLELFPFLKRDTWSEQAGTPQEDMTPKEYRAWKRNR